MKTLLTVILSIALIPDGNFFIKNSSACKDVPSHQLGSMKNIQEGIEISNSGYEAQFLSDKIRFSPVTNAPAFEWSLVDAEKVQPRTEPGKIIYQRKEYTEEYILKSTTIEQQFVVQKLPGGDGPLLISGSITCKGEFSVDGTGWAWKNEHGAVTLSDVYAYDANHQEVKAQMEVTATGTVIEIAREYLEHATFPVTIDPELGSDYRISTFGGSGSTTQLAFNSAISYSVSTNKYLTVWSGSVNNEFEIYGQLMDGATGLPSGSTIPISAMGPAGDVNYTALQPDIATSGSEFLVVWSADDNSSPLIDNEMEIYGQRVNASTGALVGSRIRISDMGPDGDANYDATAPAIVYNETNSEYLVTWQGDDNTGSLINDEYEIYVQRLSSTGDGTSYANDVRISDMGSDGNASFQAFTPDLAWNSDNNEYWVVWRGDDSLFPLVDGEYEIFAQQLTSSATTTGTNDLRLSFMGTNGNTAFGAEEPSIAYNSITNNFFVAWLSDNNSGGVVDNELEIYGLPLSNTGTIGTMIRVSDMGPDGNTSYAALSPSVQHDSNLNQFLVVWQGDDNAATIDNEFEIFTQLVSSAGAEVSTDMQLSSVGGNGNTTYTAQSPALVYNPTYREYIVTWHGDNNIVGGMVDNEFEIWGHKFAELSTEPTAQPTLPVVPPLSFTNVTSSSLAANFIAASGTPDGYIVLRRATTSPTDIPADHTVYAVNDVIGLSTVVHVGNGVTFNESGLSANTAYYYDYFSYNGVYSSTNYRTASPLEANVNTLFGEPSGQGTVTISSFGTNSITLNLSAGNGSNRLLVAKAGSTVDVFPTDGFSYTVNNAFGSGSDLGSSNYVVGSGTGAVTVTGLSPATVYHFRVFEFNGTLLLTNYNTGLITNTTASQSTLSNQPTAQPTTPVSFTSITNSSFNVGFTAASPVPSGYIAIRKSGSVPAQPADLPVDGTVYAVNDIIGGSTVAYVGATNSFSQSSLSAGTEYYYLILSYNGSGANINYLTTTPLAGNQFTLSNEPTTQATAVSFSSLATTSMTIGWSNGNGSERLVVVREASAVSFTPSDGTAYTGNANFTAATDQGSGNKVMYRGNSNSVALTNLSVGTIYHVRVFELNGSGQSTNYFMSTGTGNPNSRTTLVSEPSGQATTIAFSSITTSSVQVNWSNGNGSSRLLVARQGSAVNTDPADGTSYTANNAFGTAASELGTGNYVVGSGSGPFTITGLSPNTTYHFRVYEFNGSSGSQNYFTGTASGNPASTTTLAGEPTTQASGISFTAFTDVSLNISWTNGNGSERIVVARQGSVVNVDPVDGTSYTGNANFTTATDLGLGNKVVFRGTGNSVSVTNLTANTVYHFRVYELNGTGVLCNYFTTTVTNNPNSRTTLQTQPADQPGTISFSQHTTSAVRLNFAAASGPPTGYLIIRKAGSASGGTPQDGTTYSVGGSLDGNIVAIGNSTQFDDTGLTAGTTYHYAIFSFNGSGQAINYLTTLPRTGSTITVPDAPAAQSVADPGQISFVATWGSVTGATNYRLDVSADDFATFVTGYNSRSTNQLFENVDGLTAGVTYKFRVRAENANGLQSANSNAVSVTTDPPSGGGPINITNVSAPDFTLGSVLVSAQVNDGNGTKTVELFYRKITSTGAYTLAAPMTNTSGSTYTGTILASAFDGDDLGAEFYVRAQDLSGTDQSDLMYSYMSFETSSQPIPSIIRFGGTQKTYQMISIPFQLEDENIQAVFGAALGAYDKTNWRLVRWQSNTETYVDPASFSNKIELGKSYWFNSVEQVSVMIPAGSTRTAPAHTQSSSFKMHLLAGWNQIANPYTFNINWDDVLAANPTVTGVDSYNIFNSAELGFNANNILNPYEGGFVFSENAVTLDIPVTLKNSFNGRKANTELSKGIDAEEWFLPLTLVQGDVKNSRGGIGMHPEAIVSKDPYDEVTVPRFTQYLEANFYHPEFFWPKFSRDVVPTAEEHEWTISIESNEQGPVELKWDAQAITNAHSNLFLYDEADGVLIDMKVQSSYVVRVNNRKDLKIIYTHKGEYIPDRTMLGKSWPNPASSEVNIPIVLAGSLDHYAVEVDVYDLKGVKQKSLGLGEYPAGVHNVLWDNNDVNENDVPSGTYIVKLKVNGRYLPEFSKVVVNRNR